jgi:hypothetical protein
MSFNFNGLTASVSIIGGQSLPQPTNGQTVITATAINQASGSTVYTVPAGKIFYCTHCSLASGGNSQMHVLVAATETLFANCPANDTKVLTGGILFLATAAQAITFTWNVSSGSCTLSGYLVDA